MKITLIKEMIMTARKTLPADSPPLAGMLAYYSQTLLKLQAWQAAETYLRECLTIREKRLPDDWLMFNAKSMLGGALLGQKQYAEAEPLLLKGYAGMKKREETILATGKIRLTQALQRLVQLYEATGDNEEAAKWKAELTKWKAELAKWQAARKAKAGKKTGKKPKKTKKAPNKPVKKPPVKARKPAKTTAQHHSRGQDSGARIQYVVTEIIRRTETIRFSVR